MRQYERYRRMTDYYPPNTRVRVVVPADPFTGWSGVVTETFNEAGEMVHKVAFGDGNSAYYEAEELRRARTQHDDPRSAT
jgi:hypothetical protein